MSRRDAAVAIALALLAAAALAAVLFSDSAGASWPGRQGPIVYVAVSPGKYRYSYETHGLRLLQPGAPGSERQLTTDPTDSDPQVSPDGRTVVFSREIESEGGGSVSAIFTIAIDGSGLTQLTNSFRYGEPSFYPSGKSIVLVGPGPGGNPDLYSMRLDGSNLRPIVSTPAAERAPAVSPTGRQIAFECIPPEPHSGHQNICSMRPDGSHRRNLTPRLGQNDEPKDPDFDPSGHIVAFSLHPGTAADIFTVRVDGSHMKALTNRGPRGGRTYPHAVGYALPSFSPAGGSLVAVARPGNGPRLVRIKLRDPKRPQPIGAVLLGNSPAWATG